MRTSNGQHTITIEAKDNKGGVATRTVRFTKNENKIVIQKKAPFACDERPERILLNFTWSKEGATVKVEVCNNGFDDAPTWEDATIKALAGSVYWFTNQTKTAATWGIKYRITLIRNGSSEVNVSSIGGAYE